MTPIADIIVYSRDRRLVLAVETTGLSESTAQDATALRRNFIVHQLLPKTAFFLFVSPTAMFLWRQEALPSAPPDCEVSADAVLNHYRSEESGEWAMTKGELEIVVLHWLCRITNGLREADPASPPERMLIESGLYEQIRNGDVQFDNQS